MLSKFTMSSKTFAGSLLAGVMCVSVVAWQVTHKGSSTQIDAEPDIGAATRSDWTELPDIKNGRFESSAVQYKGDVYAFNGFGQGIKVEPTVEKLDADTLTWSVISNTSVAKGNAFTHNGTVLNGNEVWLIGGRVGSHPGPVTSNVWKFNLDSRVWSEGPELPVPGAAGGAALVDDRIHWFGGLDPAARCDVDNHFVYDLNKPKDGWRDISSMAPMPIPRNHFATVVLDGLIYAMGGQFTHDGCKPGTPDTELSHVFDPRTNTWDQIDSLPAVQSHTEPSTFVHKGAIYMIGGATRGTTVFRYDPSRDQWDSVAELPEPLLAPVARVVNDELIVSSGGAPSITPSTTTYKTDMAPLLLPGAQNSQDADEQGDDQNDSQDNDQSNDQEDDNDQDASQEDDQNNEQSDSQDDDQDQGNGNDNDQNNEQSDSQNDDQDNDQNDSRDDVQDDNQNDDRDNDQNNSQDDNRSQDNNAGQDNNSQDNNESSVDIQDSPDEVSSNSLGSVLDDQNSSTPEPDSRNCIYSSAGDNNGWGWDPIALVSCPPLPVDETEGESLQTPVNINAENVDVEPSDADQPDVVNPQRQTNQPPINEETSSTSSEGGGSADKQLLFLLLMLSGLRRGWQRGEKGAG